MHDMRFAVDIGAAVFLAEGSGTVEDSGSYLTFESAGNGVTCSSFRGARSNDLHARFKRVRRSAGVTLWLIRI
jgi:hypothetical protein